jgi:hypothetical protein
MQEKAAQEPGSSSLKATKNSDRRSTTGRSSGALVVHRQTGLDFVIETKLVHAQPLRLNPRLAIHLPTISVQLLDPVCSFHALSVLNLDNPVQSQRSICIQDVSVVGAF